MQGKIMFVKSVLFVSLLICSFSVFVSVKGSEAPDPDLGSSPVSMTVDSDFDSDDESSSLPVNFERCNIIEETLGELGASADELLMKIMDKLTLGYDKVTIKNLVIDMVNESETDSIDRAICLEKLKEAIHKYDKKHILTSKLNQLVAIILENSPLTQNDNKPKIVGLSHTLDADSDDKLMPPLSSFERYSIIKKTLVELEASADELLMKIMDKLTLGYDKVTIKNHVIEMVNESETDSIDRAIYLEKLKEAIQKYDKEHI